MPSLMAPGQNARVSLVLIDRVLPEDVQVSVWPFSTSGGGDPREGAGTLRRVVLERFKDVLQPGGMPHGSHISGEV